MRDALLRDWELCDDLADDVGDGSELPLLEVMTQLWRYAVAVLSPDYSTVSPLL